MFRQILLLIAFSSVHTTSDCISDTSNILIEGQNGIETIDNPNKLNNLYLLLKEQYEDQFKQLQNKYDLLQEALLVYGENVLSPSPNSNKECYTSDVKLNPTDNLQLKIEEIYNMSSASKIQTNSLTEKVDNIHKILTKISTVEQHSTQPNSKQFPINQCFDKNVSRKRTRGKYVGCFQDNDEYRLMKGHVIRMRLNHVELCVNHCRSGNFVYAGLGHEWCFCDNTMHDTKFNYKLSDTFCDTPCKGNPLQMCGHSYVNSVYETGIEQYLVDEEGQQLPESYLPRSNNNYYKYAGSGNFDD